MTSITAKSQITPAASGICPLPFSPPALDYRNRDVVERIQKKLELPLDQSEQLFSDLLKFLSLCVYRMETSSQPLVPTKKIDEAWHHFLLFTAEYQSFCEQYFGEFIHHLPSTSRSELRGHRIDDTRALASMIYGELSENWSTVWLSDSGPCTGGTTNCQVCYRG